MGHLGVVLYEYLGEEYPEVLGSILGALKAIVNVIGMEFAGHVRIWPFNFLCILKARCKVVFRSLFFFFNLLFWSTLGLSDVTNLPYYYLFIFYLKMLKRRNLVQKFKVQK